MIYSKWRKCIISGGILVFWRLRVGRFEAEVRDELSAGDGYVPYVNDERVTQKVQRTAKQAKVVALLAIRKECKDVLKLTKHMSTKY